MLFVTGENVVTLGGKGITSLLNACEVRGETNLLDSQNDALIRWKKNRPLRRKRVLQWNHLIGEIAAYSARSTAI